MMTKNNNIDTLSLQLEHLFAQNVNFRDRIITLAEDVSPGMFLKLDSAISEMESYNRKAITIRIFSDGGDADAAFAIVGRIRAAKCKIIIEAYGPIQSAATLILASGHHRRISQYGAFMHHESSYTIPPDIRHSQVKDRLEAEEDSEERWAIFMSSFTKKTKAFWKTRGVRKDSWFTPQQLVKMGVVDEIF